MSMPAPCLCCAHCQYLHQYSCLLPPVSLGRTLAYPMSFYPKFRSLRRKHFGVLKMVPSTIYVPESSIELQTNAYVCTGWTKASNILDYSRYHILLLINSSKMRRYSLSRRHRPNPAIMDRSVLLYSNYQAYAPRKIHPSSSQ